eukprot:Phypoly_transcript_14887.p1 GENE.Phypoly_transcript_14887~~Phypoly_transcript_14887.p1  ORF type:complete len:298 (+),score=92.81 Phypoly_transcript_14887:42-896(+)
MSTPTTPLDINKLKVVDLRQELEKRGLDKTGKKEELVARLAAALGQAAPTEVTPATPTKEAVPATTPTTPTPTPATTTPAETTPTPTPAPAKKPAAAKPVATAKPAATPAPTTTPTPATTTTTTTTTTTPAPATEAPTTTTEATPTPATTEAEAPAEEEIPITQLSESERKQKRAERFGVPLQLTEKDKKRMRAERFGDVSDSRPKVSSGLKPNTAAQRLGLPVKDTSQLSNPDKLAARAAKFGTGATGAAPAKAGAIKFSAEEEEKRKKRAERFATNGQTATA